MEWVIFFTASTLILLISIIIAIIVHKNKKKENKLVSALNVLVVGCFASSALIFAPIYYEQINGDKFHILKSVLYSIHHAISLFGLDGDYGLVFDNTKTAPEWLKSFYSLYAIALYYFAPVLTIGYILNFFKNVSSHIRYSLSYFKDAYIFSELNKESYTLASDIMDKHTDAAIIFTKALENDDKASVELLKKARRIGAICFKKDIVSTNLKFHSSKSKMSFFAIDADEKKNIDHSIKLVDSYKIRENTHLYIFSTSLSGELLITNLEKGAMKVRRINRVRSLVVRTLYENGSTIFENANPTADGNKLISAVIVGMGEHGTAMLKALAWYCQMDGYRVRLDAFDIDPNAEERFSALCPELMDSAYNGVSIPGEAEYTIRIHSGVDVETKTFADHIRKLKNASYVLVALEDDDHNIKTTAELRMLFEQIGVHPVIQTIIHSTEQKNILTGIKNYRGQKYDIEFIGDVESLYSENVIIDSEVEAEALRRHLKWGDEEEFWKYEYNYRSSVASALHMKARLFCGIPGAGKSESELTDEESKVIEMLEHRRWNAYMRAEGYIYSGSTDPKSRNDLGKMHHDLVDYSSLSDGEKIKDKRVGSN